ncbi:MAG: ComEC/Rec2 family competence protein [Acidobacteriota bacterium]|nr:ComEC/Rec2 family competence protein [Blastocatellia bacterium]MDW8168154.1 ComEC/Rec2 family competence protein [Acidobacteriota bacterium]MDW8257598.1 ComEC/Rec2 family competence protein [Acidobacteriota bacterium]
MSASPPYPGDSPRPVEAPRFAPLDPRFQPMLFLAAAFAAGIALGRVLPHRPLLWGIIATGTWFLGLTARRSRAFVPILLVGYSLVGILHLQLAEGRSASPRLRTLYDRGLLAAGEATRVIGRLAASPERAPGRVYLDIDVEHVVAFERIYCTSGRLRLMVALPDAEARAIYERLGLRYGQRLQALGRLVRLKRHQNPGSPEYDEYLEQRGYDLAAVSKSPLLLEPLEETSPAPFPHAASCARSSTQEFARGLLVRVLTPLSDIKELLEQEIDRVFREAGPRTAGLLKALLLGNRHFLEAHMAEALRAGGTFHIVVISGLHVGFLAGMLFAVISWYTRRSFWRAFGTLIPLWGYALMVGGQPPVWRATVMVTVFLLASLLFRQAPVANNLGIAALVLLVITPQQLFSPSFHLSFVAAGSLALLVAPLIARLQAIGSWRPTPEHPYPPQSSEIVRRLAECLFWNERQFQREQKTSLIRFRLEKGSLARALNRFRLQPLVRALVLSLLVSSIVQLAMLPLMVEYFHRTALIGIALNVVVGATIALLGLTALFALALSLWQESLATYPVTLSRVLTEATVASSELALRFPALSPRVPDYSGAGVLVYLAYWAILLYFAYRLHAWRPLDPPAHTLPQPGARHRDRPLRVRRLALSIALVLLTVNLGFLVAHPFPPARPKGWLLLHFLDVGHGDAILLESPDGTTMLVDAGGEIGPSPTQMADDGEPEFVEDRLPIGEAVVSNFLWSRRLKRIDLLVPTHAHADHLRGFLNVVRNFDIGAVLLVRRPSKDPIFSAFLQEVQRRRIPVVEIQQGDRLRIGRAIPPVTATVLWPPPSDRPPETWENADSLVLRIQYGDTKLLLTGDIERAAEEALLAAGWELQSDVLKVPHHGSRTSSSDAFLERVRPRWAIVTAADPVAGRFRYPHPEVRERYDRRAISLFHTGQQGLITLMTDGQTFRISPFGR